VNKPTFEGQPIVTAFDVDGVINVFPEWPEKIEGETVEMRKAKWNETARAQGLTVWEGSLYEEYPAMHFYHPDISEIILWLDANTEFGWCTSHSEGGLIIGRLVCSLPEREVFLNSCRPLGIDSDEWAEKRWGKDFIESLTHKQQQETGKEWLFIDGRMVALHETMGSRALLWIDDDAKAPLSQIWADERNSDIAPTKIIAPDGRTGMTLDHLQEAKEWIEEIAD